jgi:multidrug efflux pump subunit AcrA (membrane-fusion protein)
MRSGSRVFALSAVVILALSSLILAQTATTSLRGTVTDPKGAVLPGAVVTIVDVQNGYSRTVKTDGHGEYQFLQLPPRLTRSP